MIILLEFIMVFLYLKKYFILKLKKQVKILIMNLTRYIYNNYNIKKIKSIKNRWIGENRINTRNNKLIKSRSKNNFNSNSKNKIEKKKIEKYNVLK